MDTHMDTSSRTLSHAHTAGTKSSSTEAAQGTQQWHGQHKSTAWQGTSLGLAMHQLPCFPGELPRFCFTCEIQNHRHNSSVFIPALGKSKQRMESESERIHQVFLSGVRDSPVAMQWLGQFELQEELMPSFPAFLLDIPSSPRKALVLCAPGGWMGAIPSSWGRRSFAEPTEGTGRAEIKSTSAGNDGDFLVPAGAWEWQDQAGTLCSGAFILLYPLSAPGTEASFQHCPLACGAAEQRILCHEPGTGQGGTPE